MLTIDQVKSSNEARMSTLFPVMPRRVPKRINVWRDLSGCAVSKTKTLCNLGTQFSLFIITGTVVRLNIIIAVVKIVVTKYGREIALQKSYYVYSITMYVSDLLYHMFFQMQNTISLLSNHDLAALTFYLFHILSLQLA